MGAGQASRGPTIRQNLRVEQKKKSSPKLDGFFVELDIFFSLNWGEDFFPEICCIQEAISKQGDQIWGASGSLLYRQLRQCHNPMQI